LTWVRVSASGRSRSSVGASSIDRVAVIEQRRVQVTRVKNRVSWRFQSNHQRGYFCRTGGPAAVRLGHHRAFAAFLARPRIDQRLARAQQPLGAGARGIKI
jgi:hypothetical protein